MVYTKINELNNPLDEITKAYDSDNKKMKESPKNIMREYIKVMLIGRIDDLIVEALSDLKMS